MAIFVSPFPICGINFLVILYSASQLMFLKGLWNHIFTKMHLTYRSYFSDVLHLYLLYSYRDYACYVFHLYFTLYIHFCFHVHVYCNSSDYNILYCFTLALMYPFKHLCTLYFMYSAKEHCGLALYELINYCCCYYAIKKEIGQTYTMWYR